MFQEFKPALLFVGKFLALYLVGNLLYGIFIELYDNRPDPITVWVTNQSAKVLHVTGFSASAEINPAGPTVLLKENNKLVLRVYEGCNGVNVMIVFAAFIVAFGGRIRTMLWFVPLGLVVIHVANLARLWLLYYTALFEPKYFYYFHKYFFTAILYLIVFALWALWVIRFHDKNRARTTSPIMGKH